MAWTPDRVEILTTMWMEGKSASLIAKELGGVTRNAVIGKVHRLGLSNRNLSQKNNISKNKSTTHEIINKTKKKESMLDLSDNTISKVEGLKNKINSKSNLNIEKNNYKKNEDKKKELFEHIDSLDSENISSEINDEFLKNVKTIEKKSKKLSLMELTERHCKWPIGDPATDKFWFCGLSSEPGKPYCETHIELAFQPITSKKERRLK
mgnify:CR=1 FL=1